jgi:hypothetical protein
LVVIIIFPQQSLEEKKINVHKNSSKDVSEISIWAHVAIAISNEDGFIGWHKSFSSKDDSNPI